jgi:DNA polymerase III subunit delta'
MWERVIGQDRAVALLQRAAARPAHAYILVGPRGSGVDDAARCFAAALVAPDGDERAARLALRSMHPDVVEIEPEKTVISVDQAHDLTREAARAPIEADRKVIILLEAHRLSDESANAILKTLEEPPPHVHFVLVTDAPDELLETVRSRCQRIDLDPLSPDAIASALAHDGVGAEAAALAARLAGGQLGRARDLAGRLAPLRAAFVGAPAQLDGSAATALRLADELAGAVQDALAARKTEHEREAEELDRDIEQRGYPDRAATRLRRKLAERHARHERFERRQLLDEGFTALESAYRDALVAPGPALNSDRSPMSVPPSAAGRAVDLCRDARDAMERNPNEGLLLEWLLLQLPPPGHS